MPARIVLRSGVLEHSVQFLLNLKFTRRKKAVAFADDLILVIRGETVSEAENFSNLEMSKITAWSKRNNVGIN